MTTANRRPVEPRIEVLLEPEDLDDALRHEARTGLTATPKVLSPKWFYDELGSILFDAITRLPEYYPTRCERAILTEQAGAIARSSGADTLVELGSGTSDKTRLLLDALAGAGTLRRFAPFDVSEPTLRAAALSICAAYPGVEVEAVVGDFERHLALLPVGGRRLVAFLGGTIGNLERPDRATLLATIASGMEPGDTFLLGTDLVKDGARLEAAYDDPTGVTAAFNRNVLGVLNRRLGGHFDLRGFDHVARYDEDEERIEMLLRSKGDQRVALDALDLKVDFAAGEELRTEISAKFRRRRVEDELASAGLELVHWWTDPAGDFALSLSSLA